jgi:hypothetical protein
METLEKRIKYASRSDVFSLYFLGDLHVGSASCDEAAIATTVKEIKADPLAYWIGLGDLCEFISRHDFRFRQSQLATWLRGDELEYSDDLVAKEIEITTAKLKPIADKCLGLLYGNHEDKQLTAFDRDVHRELVKGIGVNSLSDEAWIRMVFRRGGKLGNAGTVLDIYCHHGWFAGRKAGAKVNNLHDLFGSWDADIIAVGHGHERLIAPPFITMRMNQTGQIEERRRYALMTGSYMRSHVVGNTSYASAKGFRPTDIGAVKLTFAPDKRRIAGEV